jgi:hypothetical protein
MEVMGKPITPLESVGSTEPTVTWELCPPQPDSASKAQRGSKRPRQVLNTSPVSAGHAKSKVGSISTSSSILKEH